MFSAAAVGLRSCCACIQPVGVSIDIFRTVLFGRQDTGAERRNLWVCPIGIDISFDIPFTRPIDSENRYR